MAKECPMGILPDAELQLRPIQPSTGLLSLNAESNRSVCQRRTVGEIKDISRKVSSTARNSVFDWIGFYWSVRVIARFDIYAEVNFLSDRGISIVWYKTGLRAVILLARKYVHAEGETYLPMKFTKCI
jgi:hypothetical protein